VIRTCTKTGLALVTGAVTAYRVAKESYGPLGPQERGSFTEDRSGWYRYDTPGRTVYAAEDERTAFLEALSWARLTSQHANYLEKSAEFFGIDVAALRAEVEEDWQRNGNMAPGWIPANWRNGRLLYHLRFAAGSWVDIDHGDTIASLNEQLGRELYELGVTESLTLSEITGARRDITTLLATWLREQVLDDGSYPLGIRFLSKHGATGQGHGHCWAFWLRRADVGLSGDPVQVEQGQEIALNDRAYKFALKRHGIHSR